MERQQHCVLYRGDFVAGACDAVGTAAATSGFYISTAIQQHSATGIAGHRWMLNGSGEKSFSS
jgi:hypothetical protein